MGLTDAQQNEIYMDLHDRLTRKQGAIGLRMWAADHYTERVPSAIEDRLLNALGQSSDLFVQYAQRMVPPEKLVQ